MSPGRVRVRLGTQNGSAPTSAVTLAGAVTIATADGIVDRDPAVLIKMPKVHSDPLAIEWLDRAQMGRMMRAARETSPAHDMLVTLMGVLGLRVSEACNVSIEDFREDELGYRVLRVWGKGDKPATIPVPVPVLRVVERCRGDRTSGPLMSGNTTRHFASLQCACVVATQLHSIGCSCAVAHSGWELQTCDCVCIVAFMQSANQHRKGHPMGNEAPVFLTTKQASDRAQRHPVTVRMALISGDLHGSQPSAGGHWRIQSACVDAWVMGTLCEHRSNVTQIQRLRPARAS